MELHQELENDHNQIDGYNVNFTNTEEEIEEDVYEGVEPISLVKYAGEYWFTLSDFTRTRSVEGYANEASVKSAIRTFVVRTDSTKYVSFRGETQVKNLIRENKDNPLFYTDFFKNRTRVALIHWDMIYKVNNKFKLKDIYSQSFPDFLEEAEDYIDKNYAGFNINTDKEYSDADLDLDTETDKSDGNGDGSDGISNIEGKSSVVRYLRNELAKIDEEIAVRQNNRDKILQAINSLDTLEM